jgi:hypothetical protein
MSAGSRGLPARGERLRAASWIRPRRTGRHAPSPITSLRQGNRRSAVATSIAPDSVSARGAGSEGLVRPRASRSADKEAAASKRITLREVVYLPAPGRARVASSSVRTTPARVRPRLRRDLSLGQPAPRALSTRTRCTSLLHSLGPHQRQATFLENDRGFSRQVPALRRPTGSPTSLG